MTDSSKIRSCAIQTSKSHKCPALLAQSEPPSLALSKRQTANGKRQPGTWPFRCRAYDLNTGDVNDHEATLTWSLINRADRPTLSGKSLWTGFRRVRAICSHSGTAGIGKPTLIRYACSIVPLLRLGCSGCCRWRSRAGIKVSAANRALMLPWCGQRQNPVWAALGSSKFEAHAVAARSPGECPRLETANRGCQHTQSIPPQSVDRDCGRLSMLSRGDRSTAWLGRDRAPFRSQSAIHHD